MLSRSDTCRLSGLVEACKALLKEKSLWLLQGNPGRPLLLQRSGDGTPVRVRQYASSTHLDKQRHLSGQQALEFYVQQISASIPTTPDDREHCVVSIVFSLAFQLLCSTAKPCQPSFRLLFKQLLGILDLDFHKKHLAS